MGKKKKRTRNKIFCNKMECILEWTINNVFYGRQRRLCWQIGNGQQMRRAGGGRGYEISTKGKTEKTTQE